MTEYYDPLTYRELRALSKDELIMWYDVRRKPSSLSLRFYREEIARRDSEVSTAKIVRMTRQMRNLTWIITVLTLINSALAFVAARSAWS